MKFRGLLLACGISIFLNQPNAHAQNLPTIVSYQLDTVCSEDYGYAVYDLVIQDLDFDSTYINVTNYNSTYVSFPWVVVPTNYDNSNALRTFKIELYANYGIPAGVTLSDIDIEIVGSGFGGTDAGTTTTTINNVAVRGGPVVTTDFSSMVFCSNGNPVDPSPFVDPDGGIIQYPDGSSSSFFDPKKYYLDQGDGIVYIYTDAFGCSGDYMESVPMANAPTVNVIANSSTCGNADGSAVASIIGDVPPFDVYWTTGFSETVTSSSIVNNLSSGTYYVNVLDTYGCKATGIAQISDGDLDVTANITDETCVGQSFDGAIDADILSTNGTVDFLFWNNGQTTEDLINLKAGDYTLQVHTNTNCSGFYTFTVGALPALDISVDNIMPADCSLPDGGNSGIQITSLGGSGDYSWNWNTGAVTEDIANIPSGIYTCTIMDNITGCSMTWSKNLDAFNGPSIYVSNVTPATCGSADGTVDVDIYQPNPLVFQSWNSGQITQDLTGVPAGDYTLTVMDISGCGAYYTVTIPNEKPYQPSICLLTVDTTLTYNMVVWEKDSTQDISGFNVYRETATIGVFEQVATRPFGLESFYQDNIASPMDRSWRYYLTTYDACGGESFPSFVHKTIHVVSTTTNGTDFDLHWDDYEGINYTTVDVHRYDATNGWVTIANLPYGTHLHSDTPPVLAGLDYMVTFNLSDPCTSTKVQDHNSSRSNKTASAFDPGGSTATIQDQDLGLVSIYPNPASEILMLHLDNPELFQRYEVRDINGQLVALQTIFTNNTTIDLTEFAAGVYTIHLITDSKIIVEKFVKQ